MLRDDILEQLQAEPERWFRLREIEGADCGGHAYLVVQRLVAQGLVRRRVQPMLDAHRRRNPEMVALRAGAPRGEQEHEEQRRAQAFVDDQRRKRNAQARSRPRIKPEPVAPGVPHDALLWMMAGRTLGEAA